MKRGRSFWNKSDPKIRQNREFQTGNFPRIPERCSEAGSPGLVGRDQNHRPLKGVVAGGVDLLCGNYLVYSLSCF
jgi:hypothetical protein